MDMTEQGISRMEIYRNKLAQDPEDQAHNQLRIYPNSTMPFDINFLMNFKNFSSEDGQDSVKLDTTLKKDVIADTTFDLKGAYFTKYIWR